MPIIFCKLLSFAQSQLSPCDSDDLYLNFTLWKQLVEDSGKTPVFLGLQHWLKDVSHKDRLRSSQNNPLLLLSSLVHNDALFARFDGIHCSKRLQRKARDLLKKIQSNNWESINWNTATTLPSGEPKRRVLSFTKKIRTQLRRQFEKDGKLSRENKRNIRRFCSKTTTIDVLALGKYLYLTGKITKQQLIMLEFIKSTHYFHTRKKNQVLLPAFKQQSDDTTISKVRCWTNQFPMQSETYRGLGVAEYKSLYTSPTNKTCKDSGALLQEVYDKFGINLKHIFPALVEHTEIALANFLLEKDTDVFVDEPVVGGFSTATYFACSLKSYRDSHKFTRFFTLTDNSVFNSLVIHNSWHTTSAGIIHDLFHRYELQSYRDKDSTDFKTAVRLHDELGHLRHNQIVRHVNHYWSNLLISCAAVHLTDFCFENVGIFKSTDSTSRYWNILDLT